MAKLIFCHFIFVYNIYFIYMTEPNFSQIFNNYLKQPSTPALLSKMIDKFEEYLSSIIIDINTLKFKEMYKNNSNENSKYSFKSLKINLEKYMTIMSTKYITMFAKYKTTYNYYKCIYLLIIATIKIYEFIYIIKQSETKLYIQFISTHNEPKLFFDFIINKYFDEVNEQRVKIPIYKIDTDIQDLYLHLYYSTVVDDIFSGDYDILNKLNSLIKEIMNIYSTIPYKDDYITIPQYEGICWFISFLTGICYSDKNKQLLLKKFSENEANYRDIDINIDNETDPKILLTSFVYNVIKYITEKFKKYSDYPDDCNILSYLKNIPKKILIAFYNHYLNPEQQENIPVYFQYLHILNDSKPLSHDVKNMLAILPEFKNEVITMFYKCLNIVVLNLFINNNIIYIQKKDTQSYLTTTYDIIIFCAISNDEFKKYNTIYELLNIANLERPIDYINHKKNTIPFDNDNYNLDFITHGSDTTQKCSRNTGCAHCISAIQYNNNQYFHDSAIIRVHLNKKCNDNEIKIPCNLVNANWLDNIHNPDYLYAIIKCNHIQFIKSSNIYYIIKEYSEGETYFSMTQKTMMFFVKKEKQTKGGNKIKRR